MSNEAMRAKRNAAPWIFWWKVSPAELARQVAGYSTLKVYQSARGQSLIALLLSALVTIATIVFRIRPASGIFDAVLFLGLGLFIWFGHRWAMIAAMVIWSIERLIDLVDVLRGDRSSQILMLVIWWIVFMRFFFLAFRVEQARRKSAPSVAEVFD